MSPRRKQSAVHFPPCIGGWMYWEEVYGCVELTCLQCGYSKDIGDGKLMISKITYKRQFAMIGNHARHNCQ